MFSQVSVCSQGVGHLWSHVLSGEGVRVSLDRVSGRGIWGVGYSGYPKGVGNVGVGYPEVEHLWDRVSRTIGYLQVVYPMGRVPRGQGIQGRVSRGG